MEVCRLKRLEYIKNGTLTEKTRIRGSARTHILTLEMCMDIINDVRHVKLKAGAKRPDKQVARPYALAANNDLIDYVFDWCADHDMNDFPISNAGLRLEGKKIVLTC